MAQAFGTYCRTGSLADAAEVHKLPLDALLEHAKAEAWEEKLSAIKAASESTASRERLVNRAMSFAAGAKLRHLATCVLDDFLGQIANGEQAARDLFTDVDDKGRGKFNAKGLADLSRALQVADNMTAKALGDTVTERIEGQEPEGEAVGGVNAQLAVIQALGGQAQLPDPGATVTECPTVPPGSKTPPSKPAVQDFE